MGRYGKNMRDCCDSPAQQGQPHIKGCRFHVPKGYRIDPFADARMGRSLFEMRAEDWLVKND